MKIMARMLQVWTKGELESKSRHFPQPKGSKVYRLSLDTAILAEILDYKYPPKKIGNYLKNLNL